MDPSLEKRRKKRTNESGDSSCELDMDGGRQVEYKCLKSCSVCNEAQPSFVKD